MSPMTVMLASLGAGVAASLFAGRLPPSGKVSLGLALVPILGFYYALAPC